MLRQAEGGCVAVPSSKVPLLMRAPSRRVALEWALAFLGCMRHLVARPCIVLDIDGTLIINAPNGCSKCVLDFPALCAACTAHGIAIFCITARPEDPKNRHYTERQLEKCQVAPVTRTFMRPSSADYGKYKYTARKKILAQGFSILLTIGDQFADLSLKNHPDLQDDVFYVGQLGDNYQFGIKIPSEFARTAEDSD